MTFICLEVQTTRDFFLSLSLMGLLVVSKVT